LGSFYLLIALVFSASGLRAQTTEELQAEFAAAGGYEAYLAGNLDLIAGGFVCDEDTAFEHWANNGRSEGRSFDSGHLRSDLPDAAPDANYAIDGGFAWAYERCGGGINTVVFITQVAVKPDGWAGPENLLERCDQFNLGPAFRADAYRTMNVDVANAIDSGLVPSFSSVTDHYVKYGFKEGRISNLNFTEEERLAFDGDAYLALNGDVKSFFDNQELAGWILFGNIGFAHYINFGDLEGRQTGQVLDAAGEQLLLQRSFDETAYRGRNPDVDSAVAGGFFTSGRDHFEQFGKCDYAGDGIAAGNSNLRPNDYFDNDFYLAQNADVEALIPGTHTTAWDHWRVAGAAEGRLGLPASVDFDAAFYLAQYPELVSEIGAGLSYPTALIEYLARGQAQGRNPNALFDESYYISRYEIQPAIDDGTVASGYDHYRRFGESLGYRPIRAIGGILSVGSEAWEYATIQEAINAALDGETVEIPAGTHSNGAFGIFDKSLTLSGAGKGLTILEAGTKTDPALLATSGGGIALISSENIPPPEVTLSGITFQNGDNRLASADYMEGVAGGLTVRGVVLSLSDCSFLDNRSHTGGALILDGGEGSTVDGCEFHRNIAERDGGAVAVFNDGLHSVMNSVFEDNRTEIFHDFGAGEVPVGFNFVHASSTGVHTEPGLRADEFTPYAIGDPSEPGEFYGREDTGDFTFTIDPVVGPVYTGWYAGPLGGALALSDSNPLIEANAFTGNSASFAGGAIYMIDLAAPTIRDNTFTENSSSRGGAIYSEAGRVEATISGNEFLRNTAPADANFPGSGKGGAISLYYNSSPTIGGPDAADANTFSENTAGYGGGAISVYEHIDPLSNVTIMGNTFDDNSVIATDRGATANALPRDSVGGALVGEVYDLYGTASGGAVEVADANVVISNNTFRNNIARLGGGVSVGGHGTVSGNTFQGNTQSVGAAGAFPDDVDSVGSALHLINGVNVGDLRVTESDNSFTQNTPHDIVEMGYSLETAFDLQSAGTDVFSLDFGPAPGQEEAFDEAYYLATYPHVSALIGSGEGQYATALAHYLAEGQQAGLNPNADFSEFFYLKTNPEVATSVEAGDVASGFDHYLRVGQAQGRELFPETQVGFDATFYSNAYSDVDPVVAAGTYESSYHHYYVVGQGEGREANETFDEHFYLVANPDIADLIASGIPLLGRPVLSGFDHYMRSFDEDYYLATYPEVVALIGTGEGQYATALAHFVAVGESTGLNPNSDPRPHYPETYAFFDETFYLDTYSDVAALLTSPAGDYPTAYHHYHAVGQQAGRNPNANFSEFFYWIMNTAAYQAFLAGDYLSAFDHYIRVGQAEGREIYPETEAGFDESFYTNTYSDVAAAMATGAYESVYHHYYSVGQSEAREPNASFSEYFYRIANPDIAAAIAAGDLLGERALLSGYDHYLRAGQADGRPLFPETQASFDETFYLDTYGDVAAAIAAGSYFSAYHHYYDVGQQAGRDPNATFREYWYKLTNPEVVTAIASGDYLSGFDHYVRVGQAEGREIYPATLAAFDETYYLSTYADVQPLITAGTHESAYDHYFNVGQGADRNPNSSFDEFWYKITNPEVADAVTAGTYASGFDHYVNAGQSLGNQIFPATYAGFEEAFYLDTYADVAATISDGSYRSAYHHYYVVGQTEAREANSTFSEYFYRIVNADIVAAIAAGQLLGAHPILSGYDHYVRAGQVEGRPLYPPTQAEFDESFYLDTYADVAAMISAGTYFTAYHHYYDVGQGSRRSPNSTFDEVCYLIVNPDIDAIVPSASLLSGFDHYVQFGQADGRPSACASTQAGFDESYYLATYSDVSALIAADTYHSAYHHYYAVGQGLRRNPDSSFDEVCYLIRNSDVETAVAGGTFLSGFAHYVDFGQTGGYSDECPNVLTGFDEAYYLATYTDVPPLIAAGTYGSAFDHYFRVGQGLERNPSAAFDEAFYLTNVPSVAALVPGSFTSGYDHYLQFGQAEGKPPLPPRH
jgi:predicted outer membrane repeat protein